MATEGAATPDDLFTDIEALHKRLLSVAGAFVRFRSTDHRPEAVRLTDIFEQDAELPSQGPKRRRHDELKVANDRRDAVPVDARVGDAHPVDETLTAPALHDDAAVGHGVSDAVEAVTGPDEGANSKGGAERAERQHLVTADHVAGEHQARETDGDDSDGGQEQRSHRPSARTSHLRRTAFPEHTLSWKKLPFRFVVLRDFPKVRRHTRIDNSGARKFVEPHSRKITLAGARAVQRRVHGDPPWSPRLDLPFPAALFDGVTFVHE